MRVLFVCTGNICRSPMAEGMLRARAAARGIAVEVASVGLLFDGRPATDEAVRTAQAHGIDISAHRSRILEGEAIDHADLVIGMERQHVREAVVLSDGSLARTFTLKELVRRAEATGRRAPDEPFGRWLARVGAGRRVPDLIGEDNADEVADPFRRRMADYEACGVELADLVDRLVDMAWPAAVNEGAA